MQGHNFGGYQVEIDIDATAKWYAQYKGWKCECGDCRNFLELANKKQLPGHIIDVLDEIGISPEKATYVCELFTDDEGIHYQFSYRVVGTIMDAPNPDDGENVSGGRCWHEPYPYGAPDFPTPHFDIEFDATLPWVLSETQN